MLMEIDQIALKSDLLQRARAADAEALAEIRRKISGLFLYLHNLPVEDGEEVLTLRELHELKCLDGVKVISEKQALLAEYDRGEPKMPTKLKAKPNGPTTSHLLRLLAKRLRRPDAMVGYSNERRSTNAKHWLEQIPEWLLSYQRASHNFGLDPADHAKLFTENDANQTAAKTAILCEQLANKYDGPRKVHGRKK